MKPSVGRIVHFVQQQSPEHVPGIVTYVHGQGAHRSDPEVDGTLINIGCWDPLGNPTPGIQGVPEDQSGERKNSWHWPEREEEPEGDDSDYSSLSSLLVTKTPVSPE